MKLRNGMGTFFLLTVYRQPSNQDPLLIPSLFDEVSQKLSLSTDKLVVCGDFNFPKIDWTKCVATGNYNVCNPFLYKMLEIGLEQHVFSPTHRLGNTLDLVLSNRAIVNNIEILNPLLSDHSILLIRLNISKSLTPPNLTHIIYHYSKANMGRAHDIFENYGLRIKKSIDNKEHINQSYSLLIQGLRQLKEDCVPYKTQHIRKKSTKLVHKPYKKCIKKTEKAILSIQKFIILCSQVHSGSEI